MLTCLKTEDMAESRRESLGGGADFAKLSVQYSGDAKNPGKIL